MALIEFRFLHYKYLSFFCLVGVSVYHYFSQMSSPTPDGIIRILSTLSKFTCGTFYFVSVALEGKYKRMIEHPRPFTCKKLFLLLAPGFFSALLYSSDITVNVIADSFPISFTDHNLGTLVQILTLLFVVHVGNKRIFKKVTYIHHRV